MLTETFRGRATAVPAGVGVEVAVGSLLGGDVPMGIGVALATAVGEVDVAASGVGDGLSAVGVRNGVEVASTDDWTLGDAVAVAMSVAIADEAGAGEPV